MQHTIPRCRPGLPLALVAAFLPALATVGSITTRADDPIPGREGMLHFRVLGTGKGLSTSQSAASRLRSRRANRSAGTCRCG